MEWPLSGLRFADLSAGIAGGYCTWGTDSSRGFR
jgi:hypothetical protein